MKTEYEVDYSYNALVCNRCGRVETVPYDEGDSCYDGCGTFTIEVPQNYFTKYNRLGLVANKLSSDMFGEPGALGGELVHGLSVAANTNWLMKSCLKEIEDGGCECELLGVQQGTCPACRATETLKIVYSKQRACMSAVTENIRRRNGNLPR